MTVRDQVADILREFEGHDSNRAHDHGGLTHYGLTLATYQGYKPGATAKDLLALTFDQVVDVITEVFALQPGFARITNDRLRLAVIDFAINSNVVAAVKALQESVGAHVDGIFGPDTEQIVNLSSSVRAFECVLAKRLRRYARIIRADKTQLDHIGGWINRVAGLLEA